MMLSVTIKYGGDGSLSYISDVPSDCTVNKLKLLVAKINKMDSIDSIRLVQRGKILENEQTLNTLYLNNNNTLVVYATGIPGKFHKPVEKVEIKQTPRPTTPIQNNRDNFMNRANQFLEDNRRGIIMLCALIGFTFLMAFFSIKNISLRMSQPSNGSFFNDIKNLFKGEFKIGAVIKLLCLIGLILSIGKLLISVPPRDLLNYTLLFFKSLSPTFDMNNFRASHNLN